MADDLKLRVLFDAVDKWTAPLKKMISGNKDMVRSLKESRDQLKELGKAQKDVGSFRELRSGLAGTSKDLSAAQERVKQLAQMMGSGMGTKELSRDFERAKQAAAQLKETYDQQSFKLQELRSRLSGAGIDTRNLSQHERSLRSSITETNAAITTQQAKLTELAARERKWADAREKMHKMQGVAANMAVAGYATRSAGTHVLGALGGTMDEAKKYQSEVTRIRSLGLGEHASSEAIKDAQSVRQKGISNVEKLTLMRDATSIFADEHHAKMVLPTLARMKFANEAVYGAEDAKANEEKFMNMLKVIELRGGTKDEATFKQEANMVQKVLTATGGRVGGDEWRHFIQTGGVAAKQMDRNAFFYQMEPLIQEMGGHQVGTGLMSAYSNLYQGKTTVKAARTAMNLGLLDPSKVEYDKIGQLKQIRPGALAGGDLFKSSPFEWMEKVLLPKLAAKGITSDDQIKDMISTLFSNRTASNLFTTMYMQRQQIRKSEKLNAGADDIDSLNSKAENITSGKELEALAKLHDLKLELAQKIQPLYNAALEAGASILEKINKFMQEHSTTATAIITTLTVLAGVLTVVGTLTIALAATLGPLAVIKYSLTTLSIEGTLAARVLGMGATAFSFLGNVIRTVTAFMIANPILAIIAAIAIAAYLIYENWEPIKQFFIDLWNGIKAAFSSAWDFIRNAADYLFNELPAKFTEFGANIISGLVNGINSTISTVKDAIGGVADSVVGWFKEKLGIHSPSLVFGQLGGFITQGAAIGIESEAGRVARAAAGIATVATAAFASPAIAANAPFISPSVPIDTRAAMSARPAASAQAVGGDTIIFNIYGAHDPQEVARQVEQILARRDSAKKAQRNSRLTD